MAMSKKTRKPISFDGGLTELELCEFCLTSQLPRHQGCPKHPYDVITGRFSPTKAVKCEPPKKLWTWRRKGDQSFSVGIVVGMDARTWRAANSESRRRVLELSDSTHLENWWADARYLDGRHAISTNFDYVHHGIVIHTWDPVVWGETPRRCVPDIVEFTCEVHVKPEVPQVGEAAETSTGTESVVMR